MAVKDMNNLKVGDGVITVQAMSVNEKGDVSGGDEYLRNSGNK